MSITPLTYSAASSLHSLQGPNSLPSAPVPPSPLLTSILSQLTDPLNVLLLSSSLLSCLLGNYADGAGIIAALLIVCAVQGITEASSERAIEAVKGILVDRAVALRIDDDKIDDIDDDEAVKKDDKDGDAAHCNNDNDDSNNRVCTMRNYHDFTVSVPSSRLVVGDGVLLTAGNSVPADCRVVQEDGEFEVVEKALTGEASHVKKSTSDSAYMGTTVASGLAIAVVEGIGGSTRIGEVCRDMLAEDRPRSPLQMRLDDLAAVIVRVSLALISAIFAVGLIVAPSESIRAEGSSGAEGLRGRFASSLSVSVSMAVAAVPEGLPICVAVTLALGVSRMARFKAVVKRNVVVESLGGVGVVCVDKTGTVTRGEMKVSRLLTPSDASSSESSSGPPSDLKVETLGVGSSSPSPSSSRLMEAAVICSSSKATLTRVGPSGQYDTDYSYTMGSPTEVSILKASAYFPEIASAYSSGSGAPSPPLSPRVPAVASKESKIASDCHSEKVTISGGEHPQANVTNVSKFDSDKKWMGVEFTPSSPPSPRRSLKICQVQNATYHVVKGSPEKVLAMCREERPGYREDARKRAREWGYEGARVIAVAVSSPHAPLTASPKDLTFLGLIGISDPARPGVKDAVESLKSGGVKVVMITGDCMETAISVARQTGISPSRQAADVEGPIGYAVSGDEIDAMTDEELSRSTVCASVFYRTSPRHKLRIVTAYQKSGATVAMTGDGINDAPALKGADIGVAMGATGCDVAKEAADMVIMDDNFMTICEAVREGKGIFFNIRNFLTFQLSTSVAALLMGMTASLLGLPSPLNAMQILWINIIMDGPPAQSLGVEPVSAAVLSAPPRKQSEPIITNSLAFRVVTSGLLIVLGTMLVFYEAMEDGVVSRKENTATFMTFVNFDLFNAYCCRSDSKAFYEMDPFSNTAFNVAVGGSMLGQLMLIYFPPLQSIFQTEALALYDLIRIVAIASSMLLLDAARKKCTLPASIIPKRYSAHGKKNDGGNGRGAGNGNVNGSDSLVSFKTRDIEAEQPLIIERSASAGEMRSRAPAA